MIEIQTDSQVLVKAFEDDTTTPNFRTIIYDCIFLLRTLKKYKLRHIYNKKNAVVDLLAKYRLPENIIFTMFYHPPSFSFTTFHKDLSGTSYNRQIRTCNLLTLEEIDVTTTSLLL